METHARSETEGVLELPPVLVSRGRGPGAFWPREEGGFTVLSLLPEWLPAAPLELKVRQGARGRAAVGAANAVLRAIPADKVDCQVACSSKIGHSRRFVPATRPR